MATKDEQMKAAIFDIGEQGVLGPQAKANVHTTGVLAAMLGEGPDALREKGAMILSNDVASLRGDRFAFGIDVGQRRNKHRDAFHIVTAAVRKAPRNVQQAKVPREPDPAVAKLLKKKAMSLFE